MENTEQGTEANEQLDTQVNNEQITNEATETPADANTELVAEQPENTSIVENEPLVSPAKSATAEVHIITQADMNNYPELKDQGVDVGSVVPYQSLWVYGGKNEADEAEEDRHRVGFPHPSFNY